MPDAASDILYFDVKNARDPGRVLANAKITIKKQHPDIRAFQEMLHIAIELPQFCNLSLKLCIDGVKLFVYGMEFLICALELFVRRYKFLVRRLQFFVAGLEF